MNNFWSIRTIIVCAFSVSMFFLGLAGPRDAYAERKDSVGGFMSNESFYAQERKLDSLYLTSNLEEYKAAAIAATDKSGIGVFMRNKTNFKQQIQRLLKTAATVATVVRQLAEITVAASKYAACSQKCDSCDSLFSATVHF